MAELARNSAAMSVVALLAHYSFDGGGLTVEQLIDQWLQVHSVQWVRLALVEALYQGRYKAVSVTQILAFWQRRDQPLYRFDPEFEQLVCNRLPKRLSTERQQQLNAPASLTETRSHPKAPKTSSKNQPPHQSRANLSTLSSLQVMSENLSKTANPAANWGDNQTVKSSEEPPLSNLMMRQLNKVLSSSARVKADQSGLAANNPMQSVWSELGKYSIHRFTPEIEASSFHTKLSALAQRLR